jgi:hypothetical protein
MRTPANVLSCALFAVVAACGGSASNGQETDSPTGCSFVAAPAATAIDPAAAPDVYATEIAAGVMDGLIGSYLRGEAAVYRGTLSAHTHESFADGTTDGLDPDTDIPSGPAFARIIVRKATPIEWTPAKPGVTGRIASLEVSANDSKRYVRIGQVDSLPGATFGTSIVEVRQYPSFAAGSCDGCTADFTGLPQAIAVTNLSVTDAGSLYRDSHYIDVKITTTITATLARVAPCDLRYDDLVRAASITGPEASFENAEDTGDELVWHDTGSLGSAAGHECTPITSYTIDRFVRKADLGTFGARHFVLGETRAVCAP